jgi:hypothetical protein
VRGISVFAIVFGGAVDLVLTLILEIPFGIFVVASLGLTKTPRGQMGAALLESIHGSPGLYAVQMAIGLGCSVLGGFVAASIARQRRVTNGVLASWLCVGLGVHTLATGHYSGSALTQAALVAITPVCYLAGASLRSRHTDGHTRQRAGATTSNDSSVS